MNPSEKNKLYNKYLAGDISQEEMHRLNQYALNDDFLFEALEGASSFEDSNADAMTDLASRIVTKKKKVRPLYFWISAAAGVAIIVFALTFIQSPQQEMMSDVVIEKTAEPTISSRESISEFDGEVGDENAGLAKDDELASATYSDKPANASSEKLEQESAIAEESNFQVQAPPTPVASAPTPKPEPEPARLLTPVEDVAIIDVGGVSSKKEKIEIEKKDIEPALAAGEERAVSNAEGSSLNRKEAKLQSTSGFTPSLKTTQVEARTQVLDESVAANKNEEESDSYAADDFALRFEISVIDDSTATALMQKHTYGTANFDDYEGEFIAILTLENGKVNSEIKVIKSIGGKLDDVLLELIKTFEGWKGSGNKTVRFLFK